MPNMGRVRWSAAAGWDLTAVRATAAGRRAGPAEDPFVRRLRDQGLLAESGLSVEADLEGRPSPGRRSGPGQEVVLDLEPAAGERFVALVRQPSGALTVVVPEESVAVSRGQRGRGARLRLVVPVSHREPAEAANRRGALSKIVRILVLKVVDRVVERSLAKLAASWEKRRWSEPGRRLGWQQVTAAGLGAGRTGAVPRWPASGARNLLLLHGTFSSTVGCYADLATTHGSDGRDFFGSVRDLYDDRIYGFDHFTVSRSPAENARDLLAALPAGPTTFDVVTHSRGGLVLREIVERAQDFPELAARFRLGRAVLVACPNQGTALASPRRWEETVGWVANFSDLFPDNGLTFALEFVSEGLVWLARRAVGSLTGLASMDPNGADIARIQEGPPPSRAVYSALAANFEPASLLPRLLDAGLDGFFQSANDLVVPSEGSWLIDEPPSGAIPGDRIGCFGRGGNLESAAGVYHTNFFAQPATVDFLARALAGQAQPSALDPGDSLPYRGKGPATRSAPAPAIPAAAAAPIGVAATAREQTVRLANQREVETLHVFILDPRTAPPPGQAASKLRVAKIVGAYRNASAVADFPLSGGDAGARFERIIDGQRNIRDYIDGATRITALPNDEDLRKLGRDLFECLFPGPLQRLYDTAREAATGLRLDIILTSMIHWVADLPWEFAYDPIRRTFLATEDINLLRNVVTAVPAQQLPLLTGPLRVLAVAAQPIGWGQLSTDEELELVARGFRPLQEAGLIELETIRSATAEVLHKRLQLAQIRNERIDVLHFIGHGEYSRERKRGYLAFEDGNGAASTIDTDAFRQIACRRGIRIIFLNACESGTGGASDFNNGVAQGLVAGGVPVVVGNQYKVLDSSATTFAQYFYWALGHGATVGDAAREARVAVNYSIQGENIDWAVPIVFAQNPQQRLCEAIGSRPDDLASVARGPAGARRGRVKDRVRIGLWDVNNGFPRLADLCERLNSAQQFYHYEVVEISAPIGTWRLLTTDGQTRAHVYAEQVAEKLQDKPRQLGLAKLVCLTTLPLGDQDYTDLYLWDEHPRISVFSLAGYEKTFDQPGLSRERAVANSVGGCLYHMKAHKRPPKNCPCYFNGERDPRYVAGPVVFCPYCEGILRKLTDDGVISAAEVEANRALLRVFDVAGASPQAASSRQPPKRARPAPRRPAATKATKTTKKKSRKKMRK